MPRPAWSEIAGGHSSDLIGFAGQIKLALGGFFKPFQHRRITGIDDDHQRLVLQGRIITREALKGRLLTAGRSEGELSHAFF
jgi:hypothetical protein